MSEFYTLPEETAFSGGGIAIYSIDENKNDIDATAGAYRADDPDIARIVTQAVMERRPIYNRTGAALVLPTFIRITKDGHPRTPTLGNLLY